jgi:ATP-binding protein involved in chromosome partitioning
MSSVTREQVETAIKQYTDPCLQQDLVSAKCIKNIAIDGDKAVVDVVLGFPAKGHEAELVSGVEKQVTGIDGVSSTTVNVSEEYYCHCFR